MLLRFLLWSMLLAPFSQAAIVEMHTDFKTHDKLKIHGLFSEPKISQQDRMPGIVLIHGSGAMDMDMTLPSSITTDEKPHPMFRVLAHSLSKSGAIVLRYNKRGVSQGKLSKEVDEEIWKSATIKNLTRDAEKAFLHLRKHPRVDPKRIYLLGISEGTLVAPQIAIKYPSIKGLIMLSAVGRHSRDNVYFQAVTYVLRVMREKVDKNHDLMITMEERRKFPELDYLQVDLIDRDGDRKLSLPELEAHLIRQFYAQMDKTRESEFAPLYFEGFDRDNYKYFADVKGDILFLHGDIDAQTPLEEMYLIEDHLRNKFKKNITVKIYPGFGHGLSPHRGPNGLEPTIGPIDSSVLKDINQWLATHDKKISSAKK